MIQRLCSPSTGSGAFSTHELPHVLHGPVIQEVVHPRVSSLSMMPTLQKGDQLEVAPAQTLQIGDVVVYRRQQQFICHRIVQLSHSHAFTQGDAAAGPPEPIPLTDVVGLVTALFREGQRIALSPHPSGHSHPLPLFQSASTLALIGQRVRPTIRRAIPLILGFPIFGMSIKRLLLHTMRIDIMEAASVQSVRSYLKRCSIRLSQASDIRPFVDSHCSGRQHVTLLLRLNSLHLGTCHLSPWSFGLRRAAAPLGLHEIFNTIRLDFARDAGPDQATPHTSRPNQLNH